MSLFLIVSSLLKKGFVDFLLVYCRCREPCELLSYRMRNELMYYAGTLVGAVENAEELVSTFLGTRLGFLAGVPDS